MEDLERSSNRSLCLLGRMIEECCGETLELLYYLPCLDEAGKCEACLCRLSTNLFCNVVVRVHTSTAARRNAGTSPAVVLNTGFDAEADADFKNIAAGHNDNDNDNDIDDDDDSEEEEEVSLKGNGEGGPGERGNNGNVKLWDFLEEIRLESRHEDIGDDGCGGDQAEAGTSGKIAEIEYLPFTDRSVQEVLRAHQERTSKQVGREGEPLESSSPYYLHPNILAPIAFFRADKHVFSIYPSLGSNLSSVLKYSTRSFLNQPTGNLIVYQIAQLIKFCHSSGLAFGDMSASKLLVNDQGWIYALVDFHKMTAAAAATGSSRRSVTSVPKQLSAGAAARREENTEVTEAKVGENLFSTCRDKLSCAEAGQALLEAFIAWREGAMSNFDYLILLNLACGRERGNLAFYPVLPWVVDMTVDPSSISSHSHGEESGTGDDSSEKNTWRDLTKTKWRLAKGDLQLDMTYISSDPPHHVSDEALSELTVCVYLARRLQKKVLTDVVRASFEPREYPSSMTRMYTWTPDEAIPDFYDNPKIFPSIHTEMADLQVPEWAQSPEDFVRKHRAALESPRVSKLLHHWIDLNFGYALYGEASIREKNVHLPYKDICFPRNRGRFQIFTDSHPSRFPSPRRELDFNVVIDQEKVQRFISNQFSFCKPKVTKHKEARLLDIFFMCQMAFVLCSPSKRDILYADVGCCGKQDAISDMTQELFPHQLQKYIHGLLPASVELKMEHIILCPSFESHIKDAFALMAFANDPQNDLSAKLRALAKSLRTRLVDSVDTGLAVVIFRTFLDVLHHSNLQVALDAKAKEKPSEAMERDIVGILEIFLGNLPKTICDNFLIPFLVSVIQGGMPTRILSGNRHLALDISGIILKPSFMVRLLDVLGAKKFFKTIFPKILEFLSQKRDSNSVHVVSDVLVSLVDHIPLPVTVKQLLDPMLNLLYYDTSFVQLILNICRHIGEGFIRFQLYPRLVEIVKKAVFPTGNSPRGRKGVFRPTQQISEHLSCALMLLQHIIEQIQPKIILKTLVEDTLHKDIQQPSILFQILLLPYPDLTVLSHTSSLLVEGAKFGGGVDYLEKSLLPNLEPIFYVNEDSDDSTSTYVRAISYLYGRLCREIGEDIVCETTKSWNASEKLRSKDTRDIDLKMAALHSQWNSSVVSKRNEVRKTKKLSYRWLRKGMGDKPVLTFSPIMPEGIKVAPESYMSSLEDNFNMGFRCIHQFNSSISKLRFMVAEEMGQLALAGGSASSSSSSPVIRALSLENEKVKRIYVNHTSAITGVASLSNGKIVASCENSGLLHLWEPHTEQYLVYKVVPKFEYVSKGSISSPLVLTGKNEGGCTCIATIGDMVILGTTEGLIPVFDVNTQRPLSLWQAGNCLDIMNSLSIECIASKSTGQGEICAGFSNGRASNFDIRVGEITCLPPLHDGSIKSLRYFGDNCIISGGSDKKVKVWDRRKGFYVPLQIHSGFREEISGIYPVGHHVIVTAGARMKVLDLHSDEEDNRKKPFKLRNAQGAKESSSIAGISVMGLSEMLLLSNEEGNIYSLM